MALPPGKVWCTCSLCSQRTRKHPRTGVITNGTIIDRRHHPEHLRQDRVASTMSSISFDVNTRSESQRNEPLREEEHERISHEVLMANLQADFATFNLEDRGIPTTMPVVNARIDVTARNTPIPPHIHRALEIVGTKTNLLLAEASKLCSDLAACPRLAPGNAFPGADLAARLREAYNALSDLDVKENDLANRLHLDMQSNILQKLGELDLYEADWAIRVSEPQPLPPGDPLLSSYDTSHYFTRPMNNAEPILVIAVFSVLLVNIFSHLNRLACNLLLRMMQTMVHVTIQRYHNNTEIPPYEERILKDFPRDVCTARRVLDIEPKLTLLASCPQCHYCHSVRSKEPDEAFAQYPEFCDQVPFPGEPVCGERVVQKETTKVSRRKVMLKPLRPFHFHDPKEFVASMITRPRMENLMDAYWERVGRQGVFSMEDLGDGSIVKELLNVNMVDNFSGTPKEVGRIVFGMSIDWFNPYEMRIRGPSVTAGIIVLVCLNLPGSIRYRPENVFPVGILPGPDEPTLTDINHYFRPMVNSLLELWSPGIYFRRTHDYPQGRTYRAALLPLIADYPAIRKALGVKISPRAKENFCTFCDVPRHEIRKWLDTDPSEYPRRTAAQHRARAYEWRDAPNSQAQTNAFKTNGIRYSELLRLPYWDPTRFIVVDPMHNLFLGLIQSHFRGFLGVRVKDDKNQERSVSQQPIEAAEPPRSVPSAARSTSRVPPQPLELRARTLLGDFSTLQGDVWKKKMNALNRPTLDLTCAKLGILIPRFPHRATKKSDLIDSIEAAIRLDPNLYRRLGNPGIAAPLLPSSVTTGSPRASRKAAPVLGPLEVKAIQQDVIQLITPSWVTAIPRNFGEAKAGTLKSDQWRSALNLYLPLTLIRLWGHLASTDRRKQILDNTIMLLHAVNYASAAIMTEAKARMYTVCMKEYLTGLSQLFPHKDLLPNHHMALHIEECLTRFGPIRGWWAFPFERLVGAMQHIQTNWKFGELEHTMISSYMAGSNIRIMLSSGRQPEALKACQDTIAEYIGTDILGTLTIETLHADSDNITDTFQVDSSGNVSADVQWENTSRLPQQIYQALCSYLLRTLQTPVLEPSPKAVLYNHFTKGGRKYSTSKATYRDSLVLYKKTAQGRTVPGSIHSVFSRVDGRHSDGSLIAGHYIAIQPFDERDVTVFDPYRRYSAYGAFVWRNKLASGVDIIRPQDIVSQFAMAPLHLDQSSDFMIVIPLKPA